MKSGWLKRALEGASDEYTRWAEGRLQEVTPIAATATYKKSGLKCPKCKGELFNAPVPCPDHLPGCCVSHYGYQCEKCGRYFR